MIIRDAKPGDTEAACDAVRRSITDLCGLDHKSDPATLDAWLANKTTAYVRGLGYESDRGHSHWPAEMDAQIAGYGLLHRGGTVALLVRRA